MRAPVICAHASYLTRAIAGSDGQSVVLFSFSWHIHLSVLNLGGTLNYVLALYAMLRCAYVGKLRTFSEVLTPHVLHFSCPLRAFHFFAVSVGGAIIQEHTRSRTGTCGERFGFVERMCNCAPMFLRLQLSFAVQVQKSVRSNFKIIERFVARHRYKIKWPI